MRRAAAAIAEARRSRLRIRREGRIGDHDLERVAEPLAQREREREAGESAARDHHIGARNCWLVRHRPQRNGTGDTRESSCKLSLGRKQFEPVRRRRNRRERQREGGNANDFNAGGRGRSGAGGHAQGAGRPAGRARRGRPARRQGRSRPEGRYRAGRAGGSEGRAGPQGVAGAKGDTGPAGPAGPAGPQGERGAQGAAGAKGEPGRQGRPDLRASAGAGRRGRQGRSRPQGPTGPQGNRGDKGEFRVHVSNNTTAECGGDEIMISALCVGGSGAGDRDRQRRDLRHRSECRREGAPRLREEIAR